MKRLANSCLVAFLLAALHGGVSYARSIIYAEIESRLERWDAAGALELIPPLTEEERTTGRAKTLLATALFLEGKYEEALEIMEQIENWKDDTLHKIMKNSLKVRKGMKKLQIGELFEIFVGPGTDEILPLYIEEPLNAGLMRLEKMLSLSAKGQKIRIEIIPEPEIFAELTPLSRDEVLDTGVAGICKYNKVILLSPAGFDYGYPWMDTLMHEVIHLLLIRNLGEGFDIWFQEGFAKYFESIWRSEKGGELDSDALASLYENAEKNRLLPFQSFHPSLAKFSSPEEVKMAFAQLYMTMEFVIEIVGINGLSDMLKEATQGVELRDILKKKTGMNMKQLFANVNRFIKKRAKVFKNEQKSNPLRCIAEKCSKEDDSLKKARKYLRLGDILMEKGFIAAAASEYRKGIEEFNGFYPELEARLSMALMDMGKIKEAIERLSAAKNIDHKYPLLDTLLGKGLFLEGRYDEALKILENMIWINPFDIEVHRILSDIYRRFSSTGLYEREKKSIEILME